jgi:hypothetical protein
MQPRSSRTRRIGGLLASTTAASALVLGSVAAAPPAAAVSSTIAIAGVQATGNIGVNQYLTITDVLNGSTCAGVLPPTMTVYGNANNATQTLGQATFQSCNGSTFQYLFPWAPSLATTWYVYAQDSNGVQSPSYRSAINTGATTTTVSAPNTVKLGQPTAVYATVAAANGGTFSAQGTVTFSIVGGGTIGSANLNQATPSVASIQWTPAALGTVALVATYTPVNAGQAGANTNCGSSCTSAPDVVSVTSSGVNVYLANPPSMAAGVPATLTAVVSAVPSSGTVTFTANGSAVSSVTVSPTGTATTLWTPPGAGTYTIGAVWAGTSGQTGTSQDVVTVAAAPSQVDQIVIVTSAGTTLVPGSTYSVPNGTTLTFTSSTASGAQLTITETGPCTLTGGTFNAPQGNGTCKLTASSPGGNGYGPVTDVVTANLVPGTQTAKLAAPASGNINVGKTVTLEKSNQGKTNAKQTISWKITSGKGSVCNLSFPSDGSVKLKMLKKGTCKVQANARAVSAQWNAYQQNWKYKGV